MERRITDLDPIIQYNHEIINAIISDQRVMGLISNNPNIDLDSDEAAEWEKHVEDYNYVDDTTVEDGAWIMVDTEMVKPLNNTMHRYEVVIKVTCSKGYMALSGEKFPDYKGSRRDNICRFIDLLVKDSNNFGVGFLKLRSAVIAKSPNGYTSRVLTYRTEDFADSV